MKKANPLTRLIAFVVDAIILWIIQIFVCLIFVGNLSMFFPPSTADPQQMQQWFQQVVAINPIVNILLFIIPISYFILFWGAKGATPGKMLMGIKVIKVDGSKIGYGDAFLRYIGYLLNFICCCIGFIWILFDPNWQGWHDKIAQTYVVKAR